MDFSTWTKIEFEKLSTKPFDTVPANEHELFAKLSTHFGVGHATPKLITRYPLVFKRFHERKGMLTDEMTGDCRWAVDHHPNWGNGTVATTTAQTMVYDKVFYFRDPADATLAMLMK